MEPSHTVAGRVKLCSHLGGDVAMPYESRVLTRGRGRNFFYKGPARRHFRLHGPTVVVAPAQPSPCRKDAAVGD